MRSTAKKFGVSLEELSARKFDVSDFDDFDLIYAMDRSNKQNILRLARSAADRQKVDLILNVLYPDKDMEVPDPYYGGEQGFIDVYNMLNEATDKIIEKIEKWQQERSI